MSSDLDDLDINPSSDKPHPDEGLWDTVKTIFFAVLIAIFVRTFAYEPFSIPSGSMIPTLLVGDYLFVSKLSYGYSRYSFPFGVDLIPGDRMLFDEPERGDVFVFKLPSDPRIDYIKRIVGLPGDTIQVKGGILHINGAQVKRERVSAFVYQDTNGIYHNTVKYRETLPNGVAHDIIEESDSDIQDNTQVYRVPDGHYFAMGDNRDNSQDSRYTMHVGFIPRENLVGRAEFLFFSNDGNFWKIWTWPWTLRFDRFFDSVD